MRSARITSLMAVGLVAAAVAPAAGAAPRPGSLDATFGSGGVTVIEMDSTPVAQFDAAADLVLDSQERAVVAGTVGTLGSHIGVARLTTAGQPDAAFGGDGTVLGPLGTARAVAVDAADGVLVAGYAQPFIGATVLRLNADGSLDDGGAQDGTPGSAFGTAGGAPAGMTSPARLAVQPGDGRILVAGSTGGSLVVRRLTATGAVDGSFGASGTATIPISGATQVDVTRVALDGAGRILVLLNAVQIPNSRTVVVRLTTSGALDPAFGTGGIAEPAGLLPHDLVVQGSSAVLLGTSSMGWPTGLRLLASGARDAAFGVDGELTGLHHPLTLAPGYGTDLEVRWLAGALTTGGALMTAGTSFGAATPLTDPPGVESQVGLERFTADGAPDTTFGTCGMAQAAAKAPGSKGSEAIRVASQSDGSTVVLVRQQTGVPTPALPVTFVVARFTGGSGPPTPEATAATLAATDVTSEEAQLNGRIDPQGAAYLNYEFQISEDTDYVGLGVDDLAPTGVTDVAVTVTGLDPATTYHYRLVARTTCGRWVAGEDRTFTTPISSPPAPTPVGPPPGSGVLPQTQSSVPAPVALTLTYRVQTRPRQTLSRLRTAGLDLAAVCSKACTLDAQLLVDRAGARRLGLRIPAKAKLLQVGRGTGAAAADGRTLVTVRLTRTAKARLARARSATFRLRLTASSGTEVRTLERRLTLTRTTATLTRAAARMAAAPTVAVTPARVAAGGTLTVTGRHWPSRARVELLIGPPLSEASHVAWTTASRTGTLHAHIAIARRAQRGRFVLLACRRACRVKAQASFRVVAP